MLVVMKKDASSRDTEGVCDAVRRLGLTPHPLAGRTRVAIGITGNTEPVSADRFALLPGVAEVIRVTQPYKLTSREMQPEDTTFDVGGVKVGGGDLLVIAGPCSIESEGQMMETSLRLKASGAGMLRGGAFKPRTSPYAFQGLGRKGLEILAAARERSGLAVVSEAVDTESFDLVQEHVDMIQIGSRNMQNFSLLRRAGRSPKPILLKRLMSATLSEFLLAAEYIMAEGNRNVLLCERGIRTFSDASRYTLDLSAVPALKRISHLPVAVDPSHAAGRRELVSPLARAGAAVGADVLMVEVHPEPEKALSDGRQALTFAMFEELMSEVRVIASVVRRESVSRL